MKKELDYFYIGSALGWNQNWFAQKTMHDGGCAAVTACDLCICLARCQHISGIYPYDASHITKENYLAFSEIMQPYLRPRAQGIDSTALYIDGLSAYLRRCGSHPVLRLQGIQAAVPADQGWEIICRQMDAGYIVPFLLLYHRSPSLRDFQWHWFNLAGYAEFDGMDGTRCVKAVTYGTSWWLPFDELWHTGYARKGGFILVSQ